MKCESTHEMISEIDKRKKEQIERIKSKTKKVDKDSFDRKAHQMQQDSPIFNEFEVRKLKTYSKKITTKRQWTEKDKMDIY